MDSRKPGLFLAAFFIFPCLIFFWPTTPARAQSSQASPGAILGFTRSATAHENEIEQKFKALPSPDEERRQHRIFTSEPHIAGSERNNELARYIAETGESRDWKTWSFAATTCYATAPQEHVARDGGAGPLSRDSARGTLRRRPGHQESSRQSALDLSMSASGEVTAPVVYAHSGNPEDYDVLRKPRHRRAGQDRAGALLESVQLSRIQGAHRANAKARPALLIYSDPAEDGYQNGKVFPDGPWGPGEPHPARRHHLRFHGARRSAHTRLGLGAGRQANSARRKPFRCRRSWRCRCPGTMPSRCWSTWTVRWRRQDWQGGLPITYRLGGGRRACT